MKEGRKNEKEEDKEREKEGAKNVYCHLVTV
jgi:hypothetical protein